MLNHTPRLRWRSFISCFATRHSGFFHIAKRIVVPSLFAATALAVFIWLGRPSALAGDFLSFYSGASLSREGRIAAIYDESTLSRRQRELAPEVQRVAPFDRPPFYAAALMPLSRWPYREAYGVWVAVQVCLLAVCWIWAVRQFGEKAIAYTCLYLPPMIGISLGQDCVILPLIVIAAYVLAKKKLHFASGLALGAGLFKFHLFVLWPLCLAAQKRWKMLAGFAVMAAAELMVSLHLVGWDGISSYVQLLLSSNSRALHPAPPKVVSLWGLLANVGINHAVVGIVCGVAGAICVTVLLRQTRLEQLFTVATAGSVVIVPHVYIYDAAVLLLPLWLAIFVCTDRLVRRTAIWFSKPHVFAFLLVLWPPFTAVPAIVLLTFVALAAKSRAASWADETSASFVSQRQQGPAD